MVTVLAPTSANTSRIRTRMLEALRDTNGEAAAAEAIYRAWVDDDDTLRDELITWAIGELRRLAGHRLRVESWRALPSSLAPVEPPPPPANVTPHTAKRKATTLAGLRQPARPDSPISRLSRLLEMPLPCKGHQVLLRDATAEDLIANIALYGKQEAGNRGRKEFLQRVLDGLGEAKHVRDRYTESALRALQEQH